LEELVNHVLRKGKASVEKVYVLREKEILAALLVNFYEQVDNKIDSADVSIKEVEGPIVVGNLDQSDVEKLLVGAVANNNEAESSESAYENFQPTWCPSGLSKTQRLKLQHA
jgi:hypothetical protein